MLLGCFFHTVCSGTIYQDYQLSQEDIKTKIYAIPLEERLYLEKFFTKLIRTEGLGYVLFGSKPLCLSGYFIQVPIGNIVLGSENFLLKKGWEIWKKYEYLFCHPNYLIFEEGHVRGDKNLHPIYFINKKNLLKVIQNNHSLFEKELRVSFEPEKFLADISEKQALSEMIHFHEGLLGILLGYGVESSMQFYKRDLMWNSKLPIEYEEIYLQEVSKQLFQLEPILEKFKLIQFVGNPQSQEVKAILEQNRKEREFLMELYAQECFLEITIQKLTEE
jgi:hypothetical protein